ncbi:MAG: GTP 3',8-cyclase MoaA [Quinella sp. 3Q1]|nr:GTP 3',8-cyclase MoaA [Quinella sp. 3Q1]MBR3050328.1 GTP 3',8-cyclase MoaA [Selenomonadaceae bacterium]MBR6889242.1 GTP 3',8-cyclase MoaA [Selenomonadaceae bacterium]
MKDQFGREIEYARISVTDRCNLRCRYCMPECGVKKIPHAEILTLEEVLRVAKIFSRLGIRKIRLTGGEPLLRKNLSTLVRELKNLSGIEQVTLTTNGVLLKNFAPELIAAGLDGVNLSLDTLDEKIFADLTRRRFFDKVLEGFQTLLNENLSVKINCVPLRGVNDGEILRLSALAEKNFIKVRFIELMPIGCAWESGLRGIPMPEIFSKLEKNFGQLVPVREKNSLQGPAKYFQPKNFVGQIGFIDALEHKFCGSCNRIRLTAEGFLKTCLSFDAGLDVKKLLRADVGDDELSEKISDAIYHKPREHVWQLGIRNVELGMNWRQMYQIGG